MLTKMEDKPFLIRILPALIISGIIFAFSSIPGSDAKGTVAVTIPHFRSAFLNIGLKKGAHLLIYLTLGQSYFYAFEEKKYKNRLLTVVLAVLFSITDEIHQGFVLARNPSVIDLLIDGFGIWLGLFFLPTFLKSIQKK